MKAVVIHEFCEPEKLTIENVADPIPGNDEVLVAVQSAGVNYPDTLVISGKYQNLPELPFVPGKDAAGTVVATGADVTDLRVGDRVMTQVEFGAFAQRVVTTADNCHVLPQSISFAEAAAMGLVYQTAYFALVVRGQFNAGDVVLVNGAAGGVGSAAIQLVKALGGIALAGVMNDDQAQTARESGADHIIDLAAPNLRESLREQVYRCTNNQGADIVLDPLGDDIFDAAIRAVAWSGRLVVIGFAAGRIPTVKVNYLLVKNISVLGLQWSDYRDRQPDLVREVQQKLYALHAEGKLRPPITDVVSVDQIALPLRILADGKGKGKYILQME
ncbi:NADPH:quinone oxidoreductase family protein [Advenella mimigardefordensis]|uniref:Putative GroES-like domain-containing zinc-type alcohol dehydrogenase n=1 Tax=Advenella mimigardefordensis (strain DSM 17166 / LMG 22922 / DPN7) TaxID=1247726 RepID=W0PF21_ADVMD|nr:NADPH:quinone oxidoreductase family protein [Advenella mimigardefordensis]AHG64142.1 putative GroES-like domain-containing zinc-type alcohol dehydrogenase [Advenella mimigardefordensis DPN7]